jgi:23S rRNA (adenine-N6)-dimethyltransferase
MSAHTQNRVLLSQNFLKSPRLIGSLLDRFDLGRAGLIFEIGPGEGIITEQLALRYERVVAIETDARLARQLQRRFRDQPHVTIIAGDFLRCELPHGSYNVIANIPFNITSAVVAKLTGAPQPPDEAYLAMQREAADLYRGHPRESLRSVLLKPWFLVEVVHRFHRSDFVPAPRVDVVMLRLRKRGPPLIYAADRQYFHDFVVYAFTHWQLNRASPLHDLFPPHYLRALERQHSIDHEATPTSLTFEQWLMLFDQLKSAGDVYARRRIAGSERALIRQQARLQKIHRTRRRP